MRLPYTVQIIVFVVFGLQYRSVQGFECLHRATTPKDLPLYKYPSLIDEDSGTVYGVVYDQADASWCLVVLSANSTFAYRDTEQPQRQLLQQGGGHLLNGSQSVKPQQVFNITSDEGSRDRELFESIVNGDDRKPVPDSSKFPFDMIGKIEMSCPCQENTCTGTLIGPRAVLTAGHCIYDINACIELQDNRCCQQPCWDFTYMPAYHYGPNPSYGTFEVSHSILTAGFISGYNQGLSVREYGQFDVGVLVLKDPVPTNFMSVYYNCDILQETLFISGYPLDQEEGERQYYTLCEQQINACEGSQVFYHTCDTLGGMSGATLWATDKANNQVVIRGIHSAGVGASPNGLRNVAIILNEASFNFIQSVLDAIEAGQYDDEQG
eukprot:TRINITY_DN7448_c1_g1_i1.p1 TRINITY_DN7448_c1_g1~~TRINITY_DN7448_c1_g1_i1.p1  ORF type:complete len:380 (+),score=27.20 TRINITY_DN7448_c1_g1_i1:30-1169(+)